MNIKQMTVYAVLFGLAFGFLFSYFVADWGIVHDRKACIVAYNKCVVAYDECAWRNNMPKFESKLNISGLLQ